MLKKTQSTSQKPTSTGERAFLVLIPHGRFTSGIPLSVCLLAARIFRHKLLLRADPSVRWSNFTELVLET